MALSRKGKIVIGVAAVLVLTLVVVGSILATRTDTPEVTVVKAETRRELKSTVTASGEIRPVQYQNLTSEVQGRIEDIYVHEGDHVTKGQPLVKLDPTQLQSNTDAQMAGYQAAENEVRVTQSQVTAAQNNLAQAQQQLNVSQTAVDSAQVAVDSARQAYVAAQTDVDREKKNVEVARREFKRMSQLLESGVESRQRYDEAKDRVDSAEIALRNAQARLEQQSSAVKEAQSRVKEAQARVVQQQVSIKDARRAVDTANLNVTSSQSRANQSAATLRGQKTQRDKTLVVAPINGVIAEIPSKVGTFAVAGLSTTALLTIADMSSINIEVKVDETSIDKVEVGQRAKIKVDAFGDKDLAGEVKQKTPLAVGKSQTSGGLSTNINVQEAKEFRVVIELKDLPQDVKDGLRPGMSATAEITTQTVQNVIAVPLQAVIEKKPDAKATPTLTGDSPAGPPEKVKMITGVYVLNGNKAAFREVETGIIGESDREIKSGLNEGDEIITGPSRVLNTLKEGAVVKKAQKKEGDANANK